MYHYYLAISNTIYIVTTISKELIEVDTL